MRIEFIKSFTFTFETEAEYWAAEKTGYIPEFDIVRMTVKVSDNMQVDFPVKSRESLVKELARIENDSQEIVSVYQDKHYFDVQEYA